jgi:hypothetical protein
MALSPEYGWPEPDNSSLVKNGAQDIRALGDAIDTSLWNVGYGQAGKNKIINGDFGIWQRGTTGTVGYVADRFSTFNQTTTASISQQTFTPGAAPVAGYEGTYFIRQVITSGGTASSRSLFEQKIEDVRTLAGTTVTASFWAKADAAKNISIEVAQQFGSGGSAQVNTAVAKQAITTSWVRYSFTFTVPSVSGKTIGAASLLSFIIWTDAGTDYNGRTNSLGNQSGTFDFWGVQLENGSKATPFQTASGSLEGELALCQRYYWRSTSSSGSQTAIGAFAMTNATTTAEAYLRIPTTFRVTPTAVDFSNIGIQTTSTGLTAISAVTIMTAATNDCAQLQVTSTGLTANEFGIIRGSSGTGYIGLSAEL